MKHHGAILPQLIVIVLAAALAAHAASAFAESPAYELFPAPDAVDPKPDVIQQIANAMRNAQAPGNCPLGKLHIRTAAGDQTTDPASAATFQSAVAAARRDAVLQKLDSMGVRVAGRLFVESTVAGTGQGYDAVYQSARDDQKPQLRTQSEPRKGSTVKAGDTIRVTMTARDDPAPWPTGLKTIQLIADSENGRFIASENYEPCAEPAERCVVATYAVPQNPPAIVRLTALAEDHAGLMDKDVGEFPTGEVWKGTIALERDDRNPVCSPVTSTAEYTIVVRDGGKIEGGGTFDHGGYTCEGGFTAPPTHGTMVMYGKMGHSRLI